MNLGLLIVILFLISIPHLGLADNYLGNHGQSSGEVFLSKALVSNVNEHAGQWTAYLPTSCRKWGVTGKASFIIPKNKGIENIEGIIGKYRFVGNRHGGLVLGKIISQHLYAIRIDLNHKFLKIHMLRNVHAEGTKSPCKASLLQKNISDEKRSIEERLEKVRLLEKKGLITLDEAAKKRFDILEGL